MTALGLAAHGSHRKPPWYQRALTRMRARRQARRVEDARDQAYVVKIEAHVPPPQAVAQARVTALFGALHHEHAGFGHPAAAVLPDAQDERWPHLAPAYTDDTQAFGLSITEAGQ